MSEKGGGIKVEEREEIREQCLLFLHCRRSIPVCLEKIQLLEWKEEDSCLCMCRAQEMTWLARAGIWLQLYPRFAV